MSSKGVNTRSTAQRQRDISSFLQARGEGESGNSKDTESEQGSVDADFKRYIIETLQNIEKKLDRVLTDHETLTQKVADVEAKQRDFETSTSAYFETVNRVKEEHESLSQKNTEIELKQKDFETALEFTSETVGELKRENKTLRKKLI